MTQDQTPPIPGLNLVDPLPTDAVASLGGMTKPPMLINEILPEGSLTVVAGPTYSGKTFFAMESARALSSGTPFMGNPAWTVPMRKNVLFIEQDSPKYDTGRALYAMCSPQIAEARGTSNITSTLYDDPFATLRVAWHAGLDLRDGNSHLKVIKTANMMSIYDGTIFAGEPHFIDGCGLIIMDTMRAHHTGEENDSTAMAEVMAKLNKIRKATGAAILLVHHVARGNDNLRGSTAIEGAVDTIYRVTANRRTQACTVRVVKARAIQAPDFSYTIRTEGDVKTVRSAGVTNAPTEVAATIAAMPRFADFLTWAVHQPGGVTIDVTQTQFNVSDSTVNRWMAALRRHPSWRRETFTDNGHSRVRYIQRA